MRRDLHHAGGFRLRPRHHPAAGRPPDHAAGFDRHDDEVSPKSGPLGTPITVEVKGIGYRALFSSWELLYDNNFTGWFSAVTTHGSAKFTIPATGHVGDHILEVLHGEFTFPYRNMQQNPEPDRPRLAIPFTITDGPPVLPPPPELQAQKNVSGCRLRASSSSTPHFSGVGEPVKVSTSGLKPGKSYKLNWTRVIGNRMSGQGWEESAVPVAEAKADAQGRVEFAFNTPDDLGGTHGLFVQTRRHSKKLGDALHQGDGSAGGRHPRARRHEVHAST